MDGLSWHIILFSGQNAVAASTKLVNMERPRSKVDVSFMFINAR
jgi:hypothetical protein